MNDQSQMLIRAVKGPIIMITVGVLFAVDRFTDYHFHQTWPVLLIVVGLLSLLGGRRRRDYFPPPAAASAAPAPPTWTAPAAPSQSVSPARSDESGESRS